MPDKFIPLSVPNLKGNELKYVTKAVETEWVSTSGPYVNEFEKEIANYTKVKGAVSCQNGTSGLHISLLLAGVTRDDAVIVPTLTFIASVNPIKYIDATPIFMDSDDSLCMDPIKLQSFIDEDCEFDNQKLIHRESNKHIKAMVVVHVFGNMADMEKIKEIADKYHVFLIEDAAEALGTYYTSGKYEGKHAGTIGDIGVYSFNGNKILTTGGGGMIVSDNEELLNRAKHLTTQAKADVVNFIHDEVGYNYRMTNIQAALGLAQLEQLENFIEIKTKNFNAYKEAVKQKDGLYIMEYREDIRSNYWFYALNLDPKKYDRDKLINYYIENKVQTRPIWGLIHEQKPYEGSYTYKIENSKILWKRIVNLPCSTNLDEDDVNRVIELLYKFIGE